MWEFAKIRGPNKTQIVRLLSSGHPQNGPPNLQKQLCKPGGHQVGPVLRPIRRIELQQNVILCAVNRFAKGLPHHLPGGSLCLANNGRTYSRSAFDKKQHVLWPSAAQTCPKSMRRPSTPNDKKHGASTSLVRTRSSSTRPCAEVASVLVQSNWTQGLHRLCFPCLAFHG